MASQDLLPDDVWQALDPHAGRLSRRRARRLWVSFVLLVALGVAAIGLWRTGLIVARVSGGESISWDAGRGRFAVELTIRNTGPFPLHITGIGRSGDSLTLTQAPPAEVLAPRTSDTFYLQYALDCAHLDAVPAGTWPVPVRLSRWYGTETVYIPIEPVTIDAPDGMRSFSGRDPYGVEWQKALAEIGCGVAHV